MNDEPGLLRRRDDITPSVRDAHHIVRLVERINADNGNKTTCSACGAPIDYSVSHKSFAAEPHVYRDGEPSPPSTRLPDPYCIVTLRTRCGHWGASILLGE